jgi:cytochrome subunit of sulfide dehydrogenase
MAFKHWLALLPALLWQAAAMAAPDAGQRLAASCANCHGTYGISKDGRIPSLAGMPQDALVASMLQYQSDGRAGSIMPQLAKGYTAAQIELIAAYFAAQKK